MRIVQTIERSGAHLVVTLTEVPSERIIARSVWENAAKYAVRPEGGDHLVLVVPLSAELDVKPSVSG